MRVFSGRVTCWLIVVAGGTLYYRLLGWIDAFKKPQAPSFRGITLKVAALDNPAILTGVSLLRGEWEASRGGEIAIALKPVAAESPLAADILIFPGERLGDLVDAGALAVIPNDAVMPPKPARPDASDPVDREPEATGEPQADSFQYMDFAPAFRDQVSRYGEDRLQRCTCGRIGSLVLAYRRDAFEAKATAAVTRHRPWA